MIIYSDFPPSHAKAVDLRAVYIAIGSIRRPQHPHQRCLTLSVVRRGEPYLSRRNDQDPGGLGSSRNFGVCSLDRLLDTLRVLRSQGGPEPRVSNTPNTWVAIDFAQARRIFRIFRLKYQKDGVWLILKGIGQHWLLRGCRIGRWKRME